jgi:hypothetical protein
MFTTLTIHPTSMREQDEAVDINVDINIRTNVTVAMILDRRDRASGAQFRALADARARPARAGRIACGFNEIVEQINLPTLLSR